MSDSPFRPQRGRAAKLGHTPAEGGAAGSAGVSPALGPQASRLLALPATLTVPVARAGGTPAAPVQARRLRSQRHPFGWRFRPCFALLLLLLASCASSPPSKKVLILGLDGLDAQVITRLMDEGKLPNFSRLRCDGSFSPLATSIPPESPVAWSTFLTGLDAGGHGIFDFIHRDPATMAPYLSTTTTQGPGWTLPLGRWRIPLWQGEIRLNRKGRAFWEILEDHGVPGTIVRIPANYPPTDSDAKQLAGMGTPDLEGTYGTFSFYTDEPAGSYGEVSG
ncbi:MAG: hypothetical protein EHM23_32075, partial [Acidobacteria bacterium]